MTSYLKTFAIAYAIALIVVTLLTFILIVYFQIDVGSSATSIASLIGGLIFVSQKFAKNEKHLPEKSFSWKFACLATLTAFLVSGILGGVMELFARNFGGSSIFAELSQIPISFFVLGAIFMGLIYILVIRFMFPTFVKSQLKALEKHANK